MAVRNKNNNQKCPKISASEQKSARKNVPNNFSSIFFAMLVQRTTFTFVLILLSILSVSPTVSCFELINGSTESNSVVFNKTPDQNVVVSSDEDTRTHRPIYIPLTEPSPIPETITEGVKEQATSRSFSNETFATGNSLWDSLLNECMVKPSISCIQKNVYTYLDTSLGINGDVNITEGFVFKKNKLASWKYSEKANKGNEDNTVEGDYIDEEGRESESPLEEVTDALYGKAMTFFMGHDLELALPEMMFGGATLKVSPRSLEGDGAIVRLDLEPKEQGEGRIFFKKIKNFIKSKIMMAVLAVVVVVKLIKLKLFVFLPLLLGVHNAKKLFLKFLLFVFPALTHIFKLCSWYHNNYHGTKYHHHHHQISHLHHTVPHLPPSLSPHHLEHGHPPIQQGLYPPSGVPQSHYSDQQDWQLSGPGLGPEYIGYSDVHRNAMAGFNPRPEDMNDIKAWGLAPPGGSAPGVANTRPLTYSPYFEEQKLIRQAEANRKQIGGNPQGPPHTGFASQRRVVSPQAEKEALIRAAQKQEILRQTQAQAEEEVRKKALLQAQQQQQILQQQQIQQQQLLYQQKQQQIKQTHHQQPQLTSYNSVPSASEGGSSPVYDNFYTPILQRIDKVFSGLSFYNEPCRERLVCSMYKNPPRYSPHSNLISNELSRDASELQKPNPSSPDAVRFYKYMQAARDGQEKKDCLTIYPQCSVDTEKKKKK